MHVAFITEGLEPYGARGTAAEICGALPKALKSLDHTVSVISPLYRGIDPQEHSLARRLTKIDVEVEGTTYACELYTGRTVSGVTTQFIGHEDLFADADSIDQGDRGPIRRAVFAAAAASVLGSLDPAADVVHAHGALGNRALAALGDSSIARVLSPHGETLEPATDVIVVGSATDEASWTGKKVTAIAPGIDAATWNPLTDTHLPARFDPVDLGGKRRCKAEMQRTLGLPVRADVPLLALDGRGEELALPVKIASKLLRNDVQIGVLVHEGEDGALVAAYEELWDRWPDRIQVRTAADEPLHHQLLAASDVAILPSATAVSPAAAMKAQRYGSVPVVFGEGALAEAVVDVDARLETGTGIRFTPHDPDALLGAAQRALAAFHEDGFDALRSRIMRLDHSWDRSARIYERLYVSLLEEEEEEEA